MPYVFQFFVQHHLRFEESLQGERCEAHNQSGDRCSRNTVIGRGLCWQHLLSKKHLRIKQSTIPGAGKGLFALDKSKPLGAVLFHAGVKILQYDGTVMTRQALDNKYGHEDFVTAPYAIEIPHGRVEDAAMRRSPAAIINHKPHNQANCKLMIQRGGLHAHLRNRAAVVTIDTIRNGDELFADYSDGYIMHDDRTSYRTIYK